VTPEGWPWSIPSKLDTQRRGDPRRRACGLVLNLSSCDAFNYLFPGVSFHPKLARGGALEPVRFVVWLKAEAEKSVRGCRAAALPTQRHQAQTLAFFISSQAFPQGHHRARALPRKWVHASELRSNGTSRNRTFDHVKAESGQTRCGLNDRALQHGSPQCVRPWRGRCTSLSMCPLISKLQRHRLKQRAL
jgi:hypothetical protein